MKNILSVKFSDVKIIAVCTTVPESIEKINLLKPQLVFLDVELDEKEGGFTILEHTGSIRYETIFTTSHANYAAKAFRFCALHYLLRPFGEDDLQEALSRFRQKKDPNTKQHIDAFLHNLKQPDAALHKVGIPVVGGYDFILLSEIIFCKVDDNCTIFYLISKQKITATKTLKWVDELLHSHQFFRVHDSYLINMRHIKKYKKGGEGGVVELTDRLEADVSRRKKDDFLKMLADLKMIHSR